VREIVAKNQLDECKARTFKKRADQLLMVLSHPEILFAQQPARLEGRHSGFANAT